MLSKENSVEIPMKFLEVTQHDDTRPTLIPVKYIRLIEPNIKNDDMCSKIQVEMDPKWIRDIYCKEEPWHIYNRLKALGGGPE